MLSHSGKCRASLANLPAMHSVDPEASNGLDEELNSQQSAYVLAASGPTLSGMLLVGGLIVLAIIIVIVVLVFRKRIASGAAVGARTSTDHGAYGQY